MVWVLTIPADGSTPARTGEPSLCSRHSDVVTVYPRAYGGTRTTGRGDHGLRGLPPRVRGNHTGQTRFRLRDRSTPARTGEPSARTSRKAPTSVYPRAYGGT